MLAACAQPIPYERETSPPPLTKEDYVTAARAGATVYQILPGESLILVRVGRAGKMARLGHDHAIASEDVQGFVALAADPSASRADIVMPLLSLIVDQAEYRRRLELDTEISSDDKAGTYGNMRKVLEAKLFPWVKAEARFVSAQSSPPEISVSITLHGLALEYVIPVQIIIDDEHLSVSGRLAVNQSEFGLTPFSAAGGLLRVADELQVDFELVGTRVSDDFATDRS